MLKINRIKIIICCMICSLTGAMDDDRPLFFFLSFYYLALTFWFAPQPCSESVRQSRCQMFHNFEFSICDIQFILTQWNQSTLNNQKIFFSPETMIRTFFGKTYVWLYPHFNLKPNSYSPCGRDFILTRCLVPDCSWFTTFLFCSMWVFLFCGSSWNQMRRGNVTLFIGKVKSYSIQKQSPDFTSMVVGVTVMENSLSFKVSAQESKITFNFNVKCGMYLFQLTAVLKNRTSDTLKLAGPGHEQKAENH